MARLRLLKLLERSSKGITFATVGSRLYTACVVILTCLGDFLDGSDQFFIILKKFSSILNLQRGFQNFSLPDLCRGD